MTSVVSGLPGLADKTVLIAGSISATADAAMAERAREYVQSLTRSIAAAGGTLIVYLAGEPLDENGRPLTFDWMIVRELDALFPGNPPHPRLTIVTSDRNRREKMLMEQRQMLARLAARNVAEVIYLPDDIVTGGNIGDIQAERAEAMFAVGGGKGVTDRARKLMGRGIPVLPTDIPVGGLSEDGAGTIGLHRRFLTSPTELLPRTGVVARNAYQALSLEEPVFPISEIAVAAVQLVARELEAQMEAASSDVLVLTALAIELSAAQLAFGIEPGTQPRRTASGINYWRSQKRRADGSVVTCDIACFANAGNTSAASVTMSLLHELQPARVVMLGIAGGIRGKCSLGQVAIGERVVAYESMAVVDGKEEYRPETYQPNLRTRQDLAAYLAAEDVLRERLDGAWKLHKLAIPEDVEIGPVASRTVPSLSTIASGEQLFRDGGRLAKLREVHGKIEVVEMEGAGVCAACLQQDIPAVVIRGISDFGDATKDNRFHDIAAKAAALVACDLILHGLRA